MKKIRGKDILKMVALSAFAIGVFSAALIGANHLAFAAATSGTQIIPSTAEEMSIPQNLPPEGFQVPTLNIVSSSENNVHVNNTVTASAMSMEEAAELGAQYIWDVFGESIDGMYVEMMFANWSSQSRTYWLGVVFPSDPTSMETTDIRSRTHRAHNELYRFLIDAVTGLRVDISPGFGYVPQPSYQERQVPSTQRISDEVIAWQIAWEGMTTVERMAYLGLSQADIESYLQAAREFARSHFNNSELAYETERFDIFSNITDRFSIPTDFGGITFMISDNTGREAIITIDTGTRSLRPGVGIRTQDNDFIPGFIFVDDGLGIG